jgi:hypothetical protein
MNITWLELYNFLHKKANNTLNLDPHIWSEKVMIHNAETGDEYPCDTFLISDKKRDERLVLVINLEEIYRECKNEN